MSKLNPPQPVQDMPPSGGFGAIRYQRYLPKRGPSGALILTSALGLMAYGWYWVAQGNAERLELRREKTWARLHLIPLLQAESDRDIYRRLEAAKAREADAMKNVEGWSALDLKAPVPGLGVNGKDEPVYYTKRYVNPHNVVIPEENLLEPQWWRGARMFMKNPPYHHRSDFTKEHPIGQ